MRFERGIKEDDVMLIYVNAAAGRDGNGMKERP